MSRRFVCFFFFSIDLSTMEQGGGEISTELHTSVDRFDWIASKVSRMPAKIEYPGVRLEFCEFRATAHVRSCARANTCIFLESKFSFLHSVRPLYFSSSLFLFFLLSSSSKSSSSSLSSLRCFRSLFSPFPPDRCVATGIKSWKSIRYITFNEQR